jgi:hypothetical protein
VSTVLLCVVVIGLCVTTIAVETLASSDHQPATTHPERRSAWEPWRSIARRWVARAAAAWAVARRPLVAADRRMVLVGGATRRGAGRLAGASVRAAVATVRGSTRAGRRARATAAPALARGWAGVRTGFGRATHVVATGARAVGRGVAGGAAAVALAALNLAAVVGSGGRRVRRRARRMLIATSSFVARGLDRVADARARRADRRAIRAVGGEGQPGSVSIAAPTLASTQLARRNRGRRPAGASAPSTRPAVATPAGDRAGGRPPLRFPLPHGTELAGRDLLAVAPVDGPNGSGSIRPSRRARVALVEPHPVVEGPTNPRPGPTRRAPEGDREASSLTVEADRAADEHDQPSIPDPWPLPEPAKRPAGPEPSPPAGGVPDHRPIPAPGDGGIPDPGPVPAPGDGGIPDPGPVPGYAGGEPAGDEGGRHARRSAKHFARVKHRVVAEMLTPASPGPAVPPVPADATGGSGWQEGGAGPLPSTTEVAGPATLTRTGSVRARLARDLLAPASAAPADVRPGRPGAPDAPAAPAGPARPGGSGGPGESRHADVGAEVAGGTPGPRFGEAGGYGHVPEPPAHAAPGPAARVAARATRWRDERAERRARAAAAAEAAEAAGIPDPPVLGEPHGEGLAAPAAGHSTVAAPPATWVDPAYEQEPDEFDDADDTGSLPVVAGRPAVGAPGGADAALPSRRRRDGVPVRLPVPVTTRLWALARLVVFIAVLGLAVGGALVALVVALASAMLG